MNCHLLVPNLFWPAAAGVEPYRGLDLPALETLLARGRRARTAGASLERWLAAAYRLPADLPLAPYALRGESGEPGDHCWMCADPVHLKVHGDRLLLADASRFTVTPAEARDFIGTLNAYFAAEGITFIAPNPQRWYLRIAPGQNLRIAPTSEVAGRSIHEFLPAGVDGARWRRILNEAQMVLHDHLRNQERESRGELAVNSVWLWGAGQARELPATYDVVWGDHPLAAGLAVAGKAVARQLPASGAALLKEPRGKTQLAILATLPATAYGDVAAWHGALSSLERDWFAPLLADLQDSGLESIALHGLGPDSCHVAEFRRHDRFRFWRRKRPLLAYAA